MVCGKFFVDNCVPDSVARVLREAGHDVILLRDMLPTDSPDQVVARVSEVLDAVLISFDKDFKALAPRMGLGQNRFRRLSRIGFNCKEPQAARRIQTALSLIEHEWNVAQSAGDKRMIVEIGETIIRTIRQSENSVCGVVSISPTVFVASASWRSSRESSPPGDARSLRGCRCRRRAWGRVSLASRQYRRAQFPRQIPNAARLGRRYRGTLGVLTPFATQRHSGNLWYSLGLEKYWSAARN